MVLSIFSYPHDFSSTVSNVNVWVANNYFKVNTDNGLCDEHCDQCLDCVTSTVTNVFTA